MSQWMYFWISLWVHLQYFFKASDVKLLVQGVHVYVVPPKTSLKPVYVLDFVWQKGLHKCNEVSLEGKAYLRVSGIIGENFIFQWHLFGALNLFILHRLWQSLADSSAVK